MGRKSRGEETLGRYAAALVDALWLHTNFTHNPPLHLSPPTDGLKPLPYPLDELPGFPDLIWFIRRGHEESPMAVEHRFGVRHPVRAYPLSREDTLDFFASVDIYRSNGIHVAEVELNSKTPSYSLEALEILLRDARGRDKARRGRKGLPPTAEFTVEVVPDLTTGTVLGVGITLRLSVSTAGSIFRIPVRELSRRIATELRQLEREGVVEPLPYQLDKLPAYFESFRIARAGGWTETKDSTARWQSLRALEFIEGGVEGSAETHPPIPAVCRDCTDRSCFNLEAAHRHIYVRTPHRAQYMNYTPFLLKRRECSRGKAEYICALEYALRDYEGFDGNLERKISPPKDPENQSEDHERQIDMWEFADYTKVDWWRKEIPLSEYTLRAAHPFSYTPLRSHKIRLRHKRGPTDPCGRSWKKKDAWLDLSPEEADRRRAWCRAESDRIEGLVEGKTPASFRNR